MKEIKEKFGKIYDRYNHKIYRFIYLKVSSQEIAEDLASEVFMRSWSSFAKPARQAGGATEDKEIKNIQAYIYQIARNVVADHYKRNQAQTISINETAEIADSENSIEEAAIVSMEMERVRKALLTLNSDYQDLIIWRYLDELSFSELAQITGKTEENVRVGLHRALEALKGALALSAKSEV